MQTDGDSNSKRTSLPAGLGVIDKRLISGSPDKKLRIDHQKDRRQPVVPQALLELPNLARID